MSRLNPTPGMRVNQQLLDILERSHLDLDEAPNFFRILVRAPTVTSAYAAAEQALAKGQITARQREQIALAVAEINDSRYCLVAHTIAGRTAGLSDEDIRLARKAAANDPKAGAMLRFTQAVVLQRGELGDEDFNAVRKAGISELEMIEIVANIALNLFTNYLNIIFDTEVDIPLLHPEVKRPIGNMVSLITPICNHEKTGPTP